MTLLLAVGMAVPSAYGGVATLQQVVPYEIIFPDPASDGSTTMLLGSTMIRQFNPAFGTLTAVDFAAATQGVAEVVSLVSPPSTAIILSGGAQRTDTVPGGQLMATGTFSEDFDPSSDTSPIEVFFSLGSAALSIDAADFMAYEGLGTFAMTSLLEVDPVDGCPLPCSASAGFSLLDGGVGVESATASALAEPLSTTGTVTYTFIPRFTTPDVPILPVVDPDDPDVFTFISPNPGFWFDPPFVDAFTYTLFGGALFTEVGVPPASFGFGPIDVVVGGSTLATLNPDEFFTFPTPVSTFVLQGISPLVDAANPLAFPTFLNFTGTATLLTMVATPSAVPEPGTWLLLATGLAGLLGYGWRRRQRVS